MFSSLHSNLILAVDVDVNPEKMWFEEWYGILLILFLIFAIPYVLGRFISERVRMRDYGWKISLILFAALASAVVLAVREPNLGIDLGGGTILEYEIDQVKKSEVVASGQGGKDLMEDLVDSVRQRLDPAGVRQVSIRESGPERIEIKIPNVSQAEVELLKRTLVTAGNLEFRILADKEFDAELIRDVLADTSGRRSFVEPGGEARRSNPKHDVMIQIGLNAAGDKIVLNDVERANWKTIDDPVKAAEIKKDPDLVTRPTEDGKKLQQLFIVGEELARWVKIGEVQTKAAGEPKKYRVPPDSFSVSRERKDGGLDALVVIDELNVTGGYLDGATAGIRDGRLCVNFDFNAAGAKKFGQLTGANVGQPGRKRRLSISLDGELLSAPALNTVIRESGQITGDFSQQEVDWLVGVLNAGRLPAALEKIPISEQTVQPTLGQATIDAGARAIGISLIAVLVFMVIYYRFSGLVACFALVLNLVLVLGVMLGIRATFTLPGLAGLVLTVGMAVDANVLIFERIREELQRGAALRMAIRNGFGRATRTIVDANLTTLITAIVLYVIGKDQLRGFAVVLILGIGMSMFTAIFCARVIFDIAEKRRWITELGMTRILGKTNIDFVSKRHMAAVFSILFIGVGLAGVFMRGVDLFDIDFRGGAKIEAVFKTMPGESEVYNRLLAYSEGQPTDRQLADLKVIRVGDDAVLIETTQADRVLVGDSIKAVFKEELLTNTLHYDPQSIKEIPKQGAVSEMAAPGANEAPTEPGKASPPAAAGETKTEENAQPPNDAARQPGDETEQEPGAKDSTTPSTPSTGDGARRTDLPPASLLAEFGDEAPKSDAATATDADSSVGAEPSAAEPSAAEAGDAENELANDPAESPPAETPSNEKGADQPQAKDGETPKVGGPAATKASDGPAPLGGPPTTVAGGDAPLIADPFAGGSEVEIVFSEELNKTTVESLFQEIITEREEFDSTGIEVSNPEVYGESAKRMKNWKLRTTLDVAGTQELLTAFQKDLEKAPVFRSSTNVKGEVAGDTQNAAFVALFASLICIIGYIWIRFQRVSFGLAAVVALIHDVLVTLGVLALSKFVVDIPGVSDALKLEAFKISLPILAAFLTIIGYSLNDTIVVFDRVREVRGKSPDLTADMINTSINQTLSRTLLTSVTTMIVVIILYFLGGPGIHGFAFALVIGVIAGTYSSIFIACPVLLIMTRSHAASSRGARGVGKESGAEAAPAG